jgi:hypothetical protein
VVALDLASAKLADLDMQASGSSVAIELPSSPGRTVVRVTARGAVVVVRIPDGVAEWIRGEREIFELDVDLRANPNGRRPSGTPVNGLR